MKIAHSEDCTCDTEFCNNKIAANTFHSHDEHIDCWHCSSTVEDWCSGKNLDVHINEAGVRRACHSGRCKTEITGNLDKKLSLNS